MEKKIGDLKGKMLELNENYEVEKENKTMQKCLTTANCVIQKLERTSSVFEGGIDCLKKDELKRDKNETKQYYAIEL